MDYEKLHIGKKTWHFQVFGQGSHLLIALHGFGEDSKVFGRWEAALGQAVTLVAVDLPFHGRATDWSASEFHPVDFVDLFAALQEKYKRAECSLVGHSFGARILITIRKSLDFSPTSLWLIAPDGLATRRLGFINIPLGRTRKMIAGGVDQGHRSWIKFARNLHSLGLVDGFSMRYLRYHLANPQRRRRLLGVWRSLAYFPVKKRHLLQALRKSSVPIHIIAGTEDHVVDWRRLQKLLKRWPTDQLHLLKAGHQLITEETAVLLRHYLS